MRVVKGCGWSADLVECLVGVCDEESSLIGKVVVEIGNDLDGNIRLAGTRGANDKSEPLLHPRVNRLHLSRSKRNSISTRIAHRDNYCIYSA